MKYRLVLWDFDGTLADSLSLALRVYNRLAATHGFKPIEDPEPVRDMSMRQFLKSYGIPAWRVPSAFAEFLKETRARAGSVALFDGMADMVRQISELGLQQGIVSSNSSDSIHQCLESRNLSPYFQYVGGTSAIFGKEKRIRKAVAKAGIPPQDVLYIGDEIRDIEAAAAAGIDIAAVTWGLNSQTALARHKPTFLITTPADLLKAVR